VNERPAQEVSEWGRGELDRGYPQRECLCVVLYYLRDWRLDQRGSRFILGSVATRDNARELAEKVRLLICEEWQGAGGALYSAIIYQRLLEEGVEVPGYQMSAVLNAFKVGGLISASPRIQREEDVREHGDFMIMNVHSDLCNSS
jgi:hypothetical protein